jgi:hypothetical protein
MADLRFGYCSTGVAGLPGRWTEQHSAAGLLLVLRACLPAYEPHPCSMRPLAQMICARSGNWSAQLHMRCFDA